MKVNAGPVVPRMIGTRTDELEPLLRRWRQRNCWVPWSELLKRALRKELAPLAGKRYAHLVEGKTEEEAAA